MKNERLTFLFQRYIERTCTNAERQELMEIIARSSNDQELQALLDDVWQTVPSHSPLAPGKAEKILDTILATPHLISQPKKHSVFTWGRIAASVAFILLVTSTLYYFKKAVKPEILSGNTGSAAAEHEFIKLQDGSTVVLNGGSTLQYPTSFEGKATREVVLTGEGFFDIQHDPEKPFIVHTGNLKTTVLGTAFNVRAYDTDKSITVTVRRGKVKVSDDRETFGVITPDQQITFDKTRKLAEQRPVDSRMSIAWLEQDLFFNDITMAEAAAQLEERFGITIRFSNTRIKACRFTATFVKGEDLDQVLQVICEFNGATYGKDEKGTIQIDGEGCL
jgi:transmembrane sensor